MIFFQNLAIFQLIAHNLSKKGPKLGKILQFYFIKSRVSPEKLYKIGGFCVVKIWSAAKTS